MEELEKVLLVTVGLPRSGKSTWAKDQRLPIVSRDAIRIALHGEAYLPKAESMITVIEDLMIESLFEAGHDEVIVDATNTTEERRERWISDKWETEFRNFRTSIDVCIYRALEGDRHDLIAVIERMAEQITYPEDGFDAW